MKRKLSNILLVDDSDSDNFISNRVITKANVLEEVTITYGARQALDYLSKSNEGRYPCPEIIFLDINMPDMSGWDFLEEYIKLSEEMKADVIVWMLTTAQSTRDRDKAATYEVINTFTSKPLSKDKLMKIIEENFPETYISLTHSV